MTVDELMILLKESRRDLISSLEPPRHEHMAVVFTGERLAAIIRRIEREGVQ